MTGGGFQPIWLVAKPVPVSDDVIKLAQILGRRIADFGGGDAIHDLGRILRLPFTRNHPNDKKQRDGRVECLAGLLHLEGGE